MEVMEKCRFENLTARNCMYPMLSGADKSTY